MVITGLMLDGKVNIRFWTSIEMMDLSFLISPIGHRWKVNTVNTHFRLHRSGIRW